jgi:aryl-alcohol dehydrogenase-like predicted oxidoreductase
MRGVNRRDFLAATAGAATLLGTTVRPARAATAAPDPPPEVPLGNTGIVMSRVGQGTGMRGGNRQSNHTRMGFEKLVGQFRHAYDRGVTFFDLADLYGTHIYCREALRSIPREKVTILTKLWTRYDKLDPTTEAGAIRKVAAATLERFRHELTTDYLDIVLLHCMTTPEWPEQMAPYMEALAEAKEKKQVRAVGVSCHDLGAMKTAATCPWVDVVLARINMVGGKRVRMDGTVEEVVEVLRDIKANGKAVIGMKILGEGVLADQKEECIRFAQNLGLIDTMTIGFEAPEQVDEILKLVAQYPAA